MQTLGTLSEKGSSSRAYLRGKARVQTMEQSRECMLLEFEGGRPPMVCHSRLDHLPTCPWSQTAGRLLEVVMRNMPVDFDDSA